MKKKHIKFKTKFKINNKIIYKNICKYING